MRVLYYITYPQRMSGANRSLFALVSNLPKHIRPVVIVTQDGEVARTYRTAGIETYICPPPASLNIYGKQMLSWSSLRCAWETVRGLVPYNLQLLNRIRQLSVDLVHVNDLRGAIFAGPAARLAGCPVVGHLRGEIPTGRAVQQVFETICSRIITVADAVKSCLTDRGAAKATTIYNGIALPTSSNAGGLRGGASRLDDIRQRGKVVVCCFASVVPFKGIHHLLRAVAILNQQGLGDRAEFIVVGDLVSEYSDYHGYLRDLTHELQIQNVTFVGWQPDPFPFYESCDLTVLPSVSCERLVMRERVLDVRGNEGLPRTNLESMCFGLPIVSTDIAGVSEQVIDGTTGILVPPGDERALAKALARLIENDQLRKSMGAAGHQRVLELFSINQYVSRVADIYGELCCLETAAA